MTVKVFTFNPFMTNGYVLSSAGEAVLVDPSSHTREEHEAIAKYIETKGLRVRHLLLTHAHIDHIFGCKYFADRYEMSFQMHRADRPFIERAQEQALAFGVELEAPPPVGTFLDEGDVVRFGEVTLEIFHTPGHSPGSLCFAEHTSEQVVSGDVLFQGSIGRVEGLPQTSSPQLMRSIFDKLLPLGNDWTVYPGHGPATTIGRERRNNPFLTNPEFRSATGT